KAIQAALAAAKPGDAVILAGKGHETYQIIGDRTIHFDDREVAADALRTLGFDKRPRR
ncbi:MAG: UDP-N-acetylmuramoyl-L-alanyl-D-glutamate--2,6-diaminopimelate ligase, partial [Bryobacteraceae bacterium]|nr:UDP-N-acetylmuramoyl-L-alanyl-D-glutamate--2,6-diaminopimelate ligase [Bryobacteraceae bacterium]